MRENPYQLPDSVLEFQKSRGIVNFKCDNYGLLSNWREARRECPPETVERLLAQAAIEAAGRSAPCKDLRICIGLGLDPVNTVGRHREIVQHDLIESMALEIRGVSTLASIVASAPVGELALLCDEGYLPRFRDSVPDVGVCASKKSVAGGRAISLLEYMLARECETDRIVATLGLLDLESTAIQRGITRAIQFAIDEVATNCVIDAETGGLHERSDDAVFKVSALICAAADLHGLELRHPEPGKQTLLHAMAQEGTERTINHQVILRGSVDENLLYQAIERMTSPDPVTGVAPFDVNARDERGRTPLFYAFLNDHMKLVSRLLAVGADLETKDDMGISIDHMAKEKDADNGDNVMERMLLEWRASNAQRAIERVLRNSKGYRP